MAPLAFITGASSGIGQALALKYYREGYHLALVARRGQELAHWAQEQNIPTQCYQIYIANISLSDSIVAAGVNCLSRQGLPDVVIACAGISIGMDSLFRGDIDVMAQTFAINNVGLAATFHPFLKGMCERGSGTLVGIASVAAMRGLPGHGAYCASKMGVVNYCESLRVELRSSGVKVITICPGYIDTPMTHGNRYAMPFLMHPDAFAAKAFRTITSGISYRVIPWPMAVVAKVMRVIPNWLYDRVVSGRGRKQRLNK